MYTVKDADRERDVKCARMNTTVIPVLSDYRVGFLVLSPVEAVIHRVMFSQRSSPASILDRTSPCMIP